MVLEELADFVAVLAVAIGVACAVGSLYATGLRLWAQGEVSVQGGAQGAVQSGAQGGTRGAAHITKRTCSAVCFAACVAIVLFALWLMIPLFH